MRACIVGGTESGASEGERGHVPQEYVGCGTSSVVGALVARDGVAEAGARHGSGTAPASRRRVSQPADEHVAMCDGSEHGTERSIGRSHREAKRGLQAR